MVCKDVISMLDLKRLRAVHGEYVNINGGDDGALLPAAVGEACQLSDLLKLPNLPACNVCAIGAGMVVATLRLNKVKVGKGDLRWGLDASYDYSSGPGNGGGLGGGMSSRARDVFPARLLELMEDAFESGSFHYGRLKVGENRLRAIYQNLINNKGKKLTDHRTGAVVYDVVRKVSFVEIQDEQVDLDCLD